VATQNLFLAFDLMAVSNES